jgi:hypothetical protein
VKFGQCFGKAAIGAPAFGEVVRDLHAFYCDG